MNLPSLAVIVCTHGSAAEQLIKSAEMILGAQENVAAIAFLPGENAETLQEKYKAQLKLLDTRSGVLFLVDMLRGSPFNAAHLVTAKKKNYAVITGVNIPILIETFMLREDGVLFNEFIKHIIQSGKESITTLNITSNDVETDCGEKRQKSENNANTTQTSVKNNNAINDDSSEYMQIRLARIDDRLVHGQVATRWTKETNINRIIVVNDDVAQDEMRTALLKQVVPPGVTAHVINVAKAARVYRNPKYSRDKVMFLFTNPSDVVRLIEEGVPIKTINIGGMAYREGKKQLTNAVYLEKSDITAFEELEKQGVELEVRKLPSDNPINLVELLKKHIL